MSKVLFMIRYEVQSEKREGFLAHAREMREHAVEELGLAYQVYDDREHPNHFTEVFSCESLEDYENLDEKQDERFRELVARLDRFTDLSLVHYAAYTPITG